MLSTLDCLIISYVRVLRDGRKHYGIARQDRAYRGTTIELSRRDNRNTPWIISVDSPIVAGTLGFRNMGDAIECARNYLR